MFLILTAAAWSEENASQEDVNVGLATPGCTANPALKIDMVSHVVLTAPRRPTVVDTGGAPTAHQALASAFPDGKDQLAT